MVSRFRNAMAIFKCKTSQHMTASPKIEFHFLDHLEAVEGTIFNYKCILAQILQFLLVHASCVLSCYLTWLYRLKTLEGKLTVFHDHQVGGLTCVW